MNALWLTSATQQLERGGIVAVATETFYGLLVDATNPRAIDALITLKPRDAGKGIGLLLPSRESWAEVVQDIPILAQVLADAFWPGPLTVALPAAANTDSRLILEGRIGVRLGSPSPATQLAQAFGRPVTATSANPSGGPPAGLATAVEAAFPEAIAQGSLLVVPGTSPGGLASTVVTVSADTVDIVRQGVVSAEAIDRVVQHARFG